ncbi:MAG: phosphoglucomutase/phosphomannomutase family protein [Chloroflexi bacterium]|nr:phosphoglucomutase/phosphomannomutase family protein [Chloroflexota bacterium]
MTYEIKFGTDGWRGVIAEDYTFENVRRAAQGVATYFAAHHNAHARGMVIGYDYRFASEHFAAAAAEVLAANDIPVLLTETGTPTPVISYAAIANQAAGAINITASHNPGTDNGFKVRNEFGGAVDPEVLKKIEAVIPETSNSLPREGRGVKRQPLADALQVNAVMKFDASAAYLAHLPDMIDVAPLKSAGLNVIHDPMWGVGSGWLKRILDGGKTTVTEIHSGRNPIFPDMKRPEPIPPNTARLQETVPAAHAHAGFLTDGDADRVGFVAENGRFVNQLQVYALLAYYLLELRGWRGPIVKTISTTSMLNKLGEIYNVPVHETGVGFKYIAPKMLETNAMIGGEESGGFAFRGHMPERDGILCSLFLMDLMRQLNKTPTQLLDHLFGIVGPHYYDRIDTPFPPSRNAEVRAKIANEKPSHLAGLKVLSINTLDGFRYEMEDGGWMLIRFSGTEPIIRVYTETTHQDKVQEILHDGLRLAGLE